ncbi:MAG: hypothetical protein ACRD5F_10210 [Candidatus Acidiferrales bacterium]
MAQSYLIFDFGSEEEAAQQARQKLESWKRAFRLGEKLQWKFERAEPEKKGSATQVRVLVRLDFSDHEKLSHQRWLDRIPGEEPFKSASPQVVQGADANHAETETLFESLQGDTPAARRS